MSRARAKHFLTITTAVICAFAVPAAAEDTRSTTASSGNMFEGMDAPNFSQEAIGGSSAGDNLGDHAATLNLDMKGFGIYNLKDMDTSTPRPDQAANKKYVDDAVTGARDNLGNHIATQHLDMNGFQIRITQNPSGSNDATRKAYVDAQVAAAKDNLGNHTATADLDMNGNNIIIVAPPSDPNHAANKAYVDTEISSVSGDDMGDHIATRNVNLAGYSITNLADPTGGQQAANKRYVDDAVQGAADAITDLEAVSISSGAGLKGGGDLSQSRTLRFDESWGDARYVVSSRKLATGDGLSGGGDLTGNRVLKVDNSVVRTSGDQTIAGSKTFSGEIDVSSANALRLRSGTSGAAALLRNDGNFTHIMLTNTGAAASGTFNSLRPLFIDNSTGVVSLSEGLDMAGAPIMNLSPPTDAGHAASKAYVDGLVGSNAYQPGWGLVANGGKMDLNDNQRRRKAFETDKGTMAYNGHVASNGMFYGGSTQPSGTTILNYEGYLRANRFYSTQYLYFSDRTLKKDIEGIDEADGMGLVRKLRPVSYRWKSNDNPALGVIAQEVEEVLPMAVDTNAAGIKSVDYLQMIAPMLAAIQQLDDRVQTLEAQLAR